VLIKITFLRNIVTHALDLTQIENNFNILYIYIYYIHATVILYINTHVTATVFAAICLSINIYISNKYTTIIYMYIVCIVCSVHTAQYVYIIIIYNKVGHFRSTGTHAHFHVGRLFWRRRSGAYNSNMHVSVYSVRVCAELCNDC